MENIQNSQSGKMSEELSAQAKVKTSDVCWKDLHALSSQTFQFLDLQGRTGSGQNLERFPVMDGLLHGDCSTLNTGESPSVARESRLSWILEDNVPQKFYLSARACQGILVRASRRGKPLPELLKQALLDMIEWWNPGTLSQVVQKVKELDEYWRVEDNEKEARSFVQDFIRAYDNVAKRIGVPVLPMSKDGNSL